MAIKVRGKIFQFLKSQEGRQIFMVPNKGFLNEKDKRVKVKPIGGPIIVKFSSDCSEFILFKVFQKELLERIKSRTMFEMFKEVKNIGIAVGEHKRANWNLTMITYFYPVQFCEIL